VPNFSQIQQFLGSLRCLEYCVNVSLLCIALINFQYLTFLIFKDL